MSFDGNLPSAIYEWPSDLKPETRSFRLRAFNISALAAQTQELIRGGVMVQRFEARMSIPVMEWEKWHDLDGLISALRGTDGYIRLWDFARTEPFYNSTVDPAVSYWSGGATWDDGTGWAAGYLPTYVAVGAGTSRGADNLLMSGWPASLTAPLRRGDLFEIRPSGIPADHGHMYLVKGTANSDASGNSRVYFEPGLRAGIALGDQIIVGGDGDKPKSVFRLASDDGGLIDLRAPRIGSVDLNFIEVLPHG